MNTEQRAFLVKHHEACMKLETDVAKAIIERDTYKTNMLYSHKTIKELKEDVNALKGDMRNSAILVDAYETNEKHYLKTITQLKRHIEADKAKNKLLSDEAQRLNKEVSALAAKVYDFEGLNEYLKRTIKSNDERLHYYQVKYYNSVSDI